MTKEVWMIQWVDNYCQDGWVHPSRLNTSPSRIVSVGFIAHEDENSVTLTDSWSEDSGNVHCPLSIPKVSITKRLRVAELEKTPPRRAKRKRS